MRQVFLIERGDLDSLKQGATLTLRVGSQELLIALELSGRRRQQTAAVPIVTENGHKPSGAHGGSRRPLKAVCEFCRTEFPSKRAKAEHRQTKHPKMKWCHVCRKAFKDWPAYMSHRRLAHPTSTQKKEV